MCFCCCCSRPASSSLSYFLYFCCCRPSRTSRNKYKPIWPQQRHIYAICDGCGLTEFVGTGEHNSLDNGPRTVQWKQGRIQDFFRRGCTRLLLYFNTNKPHSFFFLQNTSCIRKPQVISGRGGAHPLHPPPRSAPEKDVNRRVVYAASEMGIGTLSSRLYPKMQMRL